MRLIIIIGLVLLVSWRPAGAASQADAQRRAAMLMAVAQHKLGPDELNRCIADFKSNMNDPSSFQWPNPTDVRVKANTEDVYGTTTQSSNSDGWEDAIWLMTPIRGKNGYGGLVLQCLYCMFDYDDTSGVHYVGASTRDRCLD